MIDPILLRIAKNAILSKFDAEYEIDTSHLYNDYPFLNNMGATFVTLNYDHQLRGCIGSIIPHRLLLDDIIHNAKSAAFGDPRFQPLTSEELSQLTLEVSVLTEPQILEYSDFTDLINKVQPNIDGLILKHNQYQGTFLPQVWKQLQTPELFLEHLSMKAGSNPSIYNQHPTIYRYQVDSIEENFNEVLPL